MSSPTRPSRKKVYFVESRKGEWGPVDWDLLRYWLGRGWLSPDVKIRERNSSVYVAAKDVPQLWTIAGRPYVAEDLSVGTSSGKLPISRALKKYLQDELGWPGKTDGLNYYDADKLRNVLQKAFPSESRPLLDDPDWPDCWSHPSGTQIGRPNPNPLCAVSGTAKLAAIRRNPSRSSRPISIGVRSCLSLGFAMPRLQGSALRSIDQCGFKASDSRRTLVVIADQYGLPFLQAHQIDAGSASQRLGKWDIPLGRPKGRFSDVLKSRNLLEYRDSRHWDCDPGAHRFRRGRLGEGSGSVFQPDGE